MKTTLHYRSIIILYMMTANMQGLYAQYYQRQYNYDYTTPNYRHEYLESGVCTRVNYANNDTNYYFTTGIGTSLSNYSPGFSTDSLYEGNRVRFIRNNRAGGLLNNRGYEFRKFNSQKWLNAEAHSIDEVNNSFGTGGYVVTGSVKTNLKNGASPKGGSDILFARFGVTGNVISAVSIDHANSEDIGYCIKRSNSSLYPNSFLICGSARKSSVRTDAFVARVDSAGSVLWFKTFNMDTTWSGANPTATNIAYSLVEVPTEPDIIPAYQGEIHVVGTYQDASSVNHNGFWLRLTPSGNYITSVRYFSPYPGPENDDVEFRSVKWSDDNNLMVTGFTNGFASFLPQPGPHTLLVKLTPIIGGLMGTRVIIAVDAFGLPIPSRGHDLIERINTSGNAECYISGFCFDGGLFTDRNVVFKADFTGFPVAQYLYARSPLPFRNGIDFTRNSLFKPGFALFSSAQNTDSIEISDAYIAKSYFNGCRCTNNCTVLQPFPGQLNVPAATTLLDTSITYLVTQLKWRGFNYQTLVICNQANITGGSNAKTATDNDELLFTEEMSLHPNPASDYININVTLNEQQQVQVIVFDISGKTVLDEYSVLEAGESQITTNIEELPNGIYMLKLKGNKTGFSKKFIKN